MTDITLASLHTDLAALVNPQCHWNLRGMPEVERRAMIAELEQEIAEAVAFERCWGEAVAKATEGME